MCLVRWRKASHDIYQAHFEKGISLDAFYDVVLLRDLTQTQTHTHAQTHAHTYTNTHSHTPIHTHTVTHANSHASTRARAHTHIHIHADAHPTYRAFVPAHELRNGNAISCHVNGILRHVNESWHTYE